MNKEQPIKADRRPTSIVDPAHAPGKRHLSRGADAGGMQSADRHQQQQRMSGRAASIRTRRTERGR
jgi:hypothetical protein